MKRKASSFLKCERIAKLLLEGFAKSDVYSRGEIDLLKIGQSIEESFVQLTSDVRHEYRVEMLLILIKYMIWRLSKPLDPMRRHELIRRYANKPLEHLRNFSKNEPVILNLNWTYNVFATIPNIAHEIIHEILHTGSVEYFERQNLDQSKPRAQIYRDLEVEFIYDFLESVAGLFDRKDFWMFGDKRLWEVYKQSLFRFFRQWLEKNSFFTEDNFEDAYDRFRNAFIRLGHHAFKNRIFKKFWDLYMKPYMFNIIVEDEFFRREIEIGFEEKVKNKRNFFDIYDLYDLIMDKLFKNLDEVFKDRFLISVDILSKIGQALYELHNIELRKEDIIKTIKMMVLKMARKREK